MKTLDITKPRYNEKILTVPWPLDCEQSLRMVTRVRKARARKEIVRSERKPRGSWGEGLSPVPLSANSLSPVLPSLDLTDRRGTARSLLGPSIYRGSTV